MVRVLNWCYGACAPTVNAELVDEQIRAGHRYKNTLTEIERTRRADAAYATTVAELLKGDTK